MQIVWIGNKDVASNKIGTQFFIFKEDLDMNVAFIDKSTVEGVAIQL